jgi:hypothetical protein
LTKLFLESGERVVEVSFEVSFSFELFIFAMALTSVLHLKSEHEHDNETDECVMFILHPSNSIDYVSHCYSALEPRCYRSTLCPGRPTHAQPEASCPCMAPGPFYYPSKLRSDNSLSQPPSPKARLLNGRCSLTVRHHLGKRKQRQDENEDLLLSLALSALKPWSRFHLPIQTDFYTRFSSPAPGSFTIQNEPRTLMQYHHVSHYIQCENRILKTPLGSPSKLSLQRFQGTRSWY